LELGTTTETRGKIQLALSTQKELSLGEPSSVGWGRAVKTEIFELAYGAGAKTA